MVVFLCLLVKEEDQMFTLSWRRDVHFLWAELGFTVSRPELGTGLRQINK